MIVIDMTPRGSIGVRGTTKKDHNYLQNIAYLVKKDTLFVTWWTYLGDLRRDLRYRKTKWTKRIKIYLKDLIAKTKTTTRGDDEEVLSLFAIPPYRFQRKSIHFGLNSERVLIADSTGLGKTITAMGVLFVAMARGDVRRGIIICPAGLKGQWYDEIHDFAKNPPNVRVVQPGSKLRREKLYADPNWEVLIINPELLLHDTKLLKKIKGVDYVAVDEASMIRNPETKTAQALKYIFALTRFRLALTATPIENRLRDLFSVFEFVDRRVFISEEYFNSRYIVWQTRRFKVRRKDGREFSITKREPKEYKHLNEVRVKIRSSYIRRKVSDVGLELPSLVVQWDVLDMPPRQRSVYKAIREEIKEKIKTLRGAALLQPLQGLRQACNSTRLVERHATSKRPGEVKIQRLKALLDTELAGEQVIVFTDYERFARMLAKALKFLGGVSLYTGKNKKDRERDMDAFKVGDRRVLVATKAGERGHNLQNAAVVVNADVPFNPAGLKQRLGRVRRLKSKHKTVRMINMVCRDTVEESLIMRKIYNRRITFESIFGEDELTHADPIKRLNWSDV